MTDLLPQLQRTLEQLPHRRVAMGLTALLVAVAALQLAAITWLLWPQSAQQLAWTPPQAEVRQAGGIDKIRDLPLFGELTVSRPVAPPPTQEAPKTTLRLKLTGVVASDYVRRGGAIIENNGKQGTYSMGDQIEGTSATLRTIFNDRVIIMNQGQEETLMLDGEEFRPGASSMPQRPQSQPSAEEQAEAAQRLRELRSDPMAAMNSIGDYLRVSPVRGENGLQGWRLNPGRDPRTFAIIGLQPNDLAIAMNGMDLTDSAQAMAAINQLPELDSLALTVLREGQRYEINFALPDGPADLPDALNEPPVEHQFADEPPPEGEILDPGTAGGIE